MELDLSMLDNITVLPKNSGNTRRSGEPSEAHAGAPDDEQGGAQNDTQYNGHDHAHKAAFEEAHVNAQHNTHNDTQQVAQNSNADYSGNNNVRYTRIEREREAKAQQAEMYAAYQKAIRTSEMLRAELLKGANTGEKPEVLLLKAVKVISLMIGEASFEKHFEARIPKKQG